MSAALIIAALGLYVAGLVVLAWLADRGRLTLGPLSPEGPRFRLLIYAFSLAVYCTSWTFFGAVGTASSSGWEYLPIYLGPILVLTILQPVLRKLVETGKALHTTSLADYLSTRYGRSRGLAALITLIATIGALPYLALQLRSVNFAIESIVGGIGGANKLVLVCTAILLGLFAIGFGTRHLDVTRHNRGMIVAIAMESLVKLIALCAVGLFALSLLNGGGSDRVSIQTNPFTGDFSVDRFLTLTVLSMAAILCLPRQFHVTVVECQQPGDLPRAGLIFALYLVVISAVVIPITLAGLNSPVTAGTSADQFVLALPDGYDLPWLSLLTLLGGFAAATGMVVVGGVALSIMITNDLLVPMFLRARKDQLEGTQNFSKMLLNLRRLTIMALMVGAAGCAILVPPERNLAALGILSFAAVAQFIPALIGGLYWRRATRSAAILGLTAGTACWIAFLLLPAFLEQQSLADSLLPFGWDSLTNGTVMSLAVNAGIYILVSMLSEPTLSEKVQANYIVNPRLPSSGAADAIAWTYGLSFGDLRALLERFLGTKPTVQALEAYQADKNLTLRDSDLIDAEMVRFAEAQLSRTLGASSARILLTGALAGNGLKADEVVTLLDETSQILTFNQDLLQTTLGNIPQGVSVVDRNMRLVAWNQAYLELYKYPEGFIHEGRPIEDILRYNAARGEFGAGPVEHHIARRLAHLRAGEAHTFERHRANGMVVKIQGRPIPGGGYVTTFTDVTEYKRIETALRESEQSIRFYTDNIPFPVAFTDHTQTIRFSNAAYRQVFGNRARRLSGRSLKDVLGEEDYASRLPYIRQALAGQRVSFDIDLQERHRLTHMQVSYVPQLNEDGAVTGFFGLYQDVTQRVAAEQALRETNETLEDRVQQRTTELEDLNRALDAARQDALQATKSKTRFLAAASHDVLQPLNAARLFNAALRDELATDGRPTDLVEKVENSIRSADLLLKTLLNISKLDAGGITPSLTTFRLGTLFSEIAEEFSVLAAEKGLRLSWVDTNIRVCTDKGLLRSILQNLVSNAIRYTPHGGIVIGGRRRAGEDTGRLVRIDVADTGTGIPTDRQQDIFREFTRLNTTHDGEGLGLGLATVERICRLLGHSVTVRSVEGKGSVFSVTLPVAEGGVDDADIISLPAAEGRDARLQILCVDNDPNVLAATGALLTRWGMKAELAHSLDEVKEKLANGMPLPSVLLLDYQLDGDETGYDVYDYIRQRMNAAPHAALLTAEESAHDPDTDRAVQLPIIMKPVEPAILRAFVNSHLRAVAE